MTSVLLPEGELRVARCDTLDKLIAVGDGDAALLYIYILRHGEVDGRTAARALHLSEERYERAAFTLNNLSTPASQTKAAEKAENAAQGRAHPLADENPEGDDPGQDNGQPRDPNIFHKAGGPEHLVDGDHGQDGDRDRQGDRRQPKEDHKDHRNENHRTGIFHSESNRAVSREPCYTGNLSPFSRASRHAGRRKREQ